MPNANVVTDWTRHQIGRVVFGETGVTTQRAYSSTSDEVRVPAAPAGAERPVGLGLAGALTRILMATMRQVSTGPTHRERARANADVLLETIRAHSIL
jgi:hypothetical protein